MLKVEGLVAGYSGTKVLHDLTLEVREGEFVALLGPNGHGKTTLLRVISALIIPDAGRISFDGRDLRGLGPADVVDIGVIHVPQGDLVFPEMTVENNLFMGAQRHGAWQVRRESLAKILEIFPQLAQRRRQLAGTLSGGERRMLAIGRGLMAKPRLLIVDEPSLGLAPAITQELYRRIQVIRLEGVTMLVVEEQTQYIRHLADRFYLMESGQVAEHGLEHDELDMDQLLRTYLSAGKWTLAGPAVEEAG